MQKIGGGEPLLSMGTPGDLLTNSLLLKLASAGFEHRLQ